MEFYIFEITNTNYYPLGLNHISGQFSTANFGSYYSYKYNGKELHETGMFDYGWRQYLPDLGRWNGIDAAGNIDVSGQANTSQFLGSSHQRRYMESSTGVTFNPDSFGDGYSLFDGARKGLEQQNIFTNFNKQGDLYWWTGYKDPNPNVKTIGEMGMLKLSSHSSFINANVGQSASVANNTGSFWSFDANFAFGGGVGFTFGQVTDSNNETDWFFSLNGNLGLSATVGYERGLITPTDPNHKFVNNDFVGEGRAISVGAGLLSATAAGTFNRTKSTTIGDQFIPRNFGKNSAEFKSGYNTISTSIGAGVGASPIMWTGSKTWVRGK